MSRMKAQADMLAEPGVQPEDVTILALVHQALVKMVNAETNFGLIAENIDRPDPKYGTNPDGSACYAPQWYTAMGIKTGIHARLYGVLRDLLSCEDRDPEGHVCIGSIGHDTCHWDGNGANWP